MQHPIIWESNLLFHLRRDPELWHSACVRVWGRNCTNFVPFKSWRDMFLRRPRVRFDGKQIIIVYVFEVIKQTLFQNSFSNLQSPIVELNKTSLCHFSQFADAEPEGSLIQNWTATVAHSYNPRCLHQQDDVHARRREVAGWLLQGLAPCWVLQVRVSHCGG